MRLHTLPIQRRLMLVILLTSLMVLSLTSVAFVIYEIIASGQELRRSVEMTGNIISAQASVALLYQGDKDAGEILSALTAAKHIRAAALYDTNGTLFASYPANAPAGQLPAKPPPVQVRFSWDRLTWCQPVVQNRKVLGTLWLESDLSPILDRLRLYLLLGAIVMAGSLVMALLLSQSLQESISKPILALADTARTVSERRDYSLRARKLSQDELGFLTDAFNQMLGQIEDRERALQDSADRLRLALQAGQIGTWDWHIRSNRLSWDRFVYRQFGLPPAEGSLSFEEFLQRIQPEDRELVTRGVKDAIDQRTEFRAEFRVPWPDGTVHVLAARGKATYDDQGRPDRMTGVNLDITERRKAEEAHALLAAIVASSEDAIVGKDLHGTIISWNAGAQRMFGYTPAEIIGKSVTLLTAPDRPDEEERILSRIRAGSPVAHYETVRIRKDGTAIHVNLSVSPIFNSEGQTVGVSSIARDVTERKNAEEVLAKQAAALREQAQLLDLANVLARDLQERVILWSAGMERLYGWTKNDALGQDPHALLQTEFGEPRQQIRARLLESGEWSGELVQRRRDGERITVTSRWVLHRDDAGQPAAILEVSNDITQRKLAEQEVRRLNTDLERRVRERTAELTAANRELEAFTYSVSHDLRAPLRHIDAFARIIQEELADNASPEIRNYVGRIRKGTQTMGQLIDDLLNLSRVGRAQLSVQPVPLNALVDEALADLKGETGQRSIEWRIGQLPAVECDAGLIRQVFVNLLSNAAKYTRPRQHAVIEVGCTVQDGLPVIYVRDNGVGFNMKFAGKLFGVFERLHKPEEFEGTGIGLATVRRIVQKHGGRVWAEAEPDRGASFYFTLGEAEAMATDTMEKERLPSVPDALRSTRQPA